MPLSETGVLTSGNAQPGLVEPGAGNALLLPAPKSIVTSSTLPFLAHVYTTGGAFLEMLPVLNNPVITETLNAVGHPLVLDIASSGSTPPVSWGNIIKLTRQGGDGSVWFTGIVEDVTDDYSDKPAHTVQLQPIGTELGDTYFSNAYPNPTDPATMVRDAVNQTAHLISTPMSVPLSGGLGIINFSNTTCLAVLNDAAKIAGPNWFWYVDATGIVWFQQYGAVAPPAYTVKQGADYTARKFTSPIGKLKNKVIAVGGIPVGASAPLVSTYNGSSQSTYGVRALMPPLNYPTVTDQVTLDTITNTVGIGLDRKITRVTLTLTNYPIRIQLGQQNPTLRYWEPASYPQNETYTGLGGYTPNYVVLEVSTDGPTQTVIVGDNPTAADDYQYQIAQIIAKTSISNLTYTPASLNIMGTLTGGGIQTSNNPGAAKWVIDGTSIRAIDPGNQIRVEQGNLAANGISTAGWKFRANDATGVPVFDSDGLIGVMKLLGTITTDGGSTTFALSRPAGVLILGEEINLANFGGGGAGASTALSLDGVILNNCWHEYQTNNSGLGVFVPPVQVLAAGSHTLVHNSLGNPAGVGSIGVNVFLLGG